VSTIFTETGTSNPEAVSSEGDILTEGYIDSNVLDWQDKVGTLPGTDMKVRLLTILQDCQKL